MAHVCRSFIRNSLKVDVEKASNLKYKGHTEIAARVLDAANSGSGATTTKIMYSAFLDHNETKKYLAILTENNLLEYDRQSSKYKTTENGAKFLRLYNDVGILFKQVLEA
jgi:predicted transcriptional regulator